MKKINSNKIKQIEITIAVILALILTLFLFGNPNITGYISLDFVMQDLNLTLDQSQSFIISSSSPEPFNLTSFKLSGEVIGEGRAEIYLDNNNGQQLLVYKNIKPKTGGMNIITGLFTAGEKDTETETAKKESYLELKPGHFLKDEESLPLSEKERTVEGIFKNECYDTCFIRMELSNQLAYQLLFKIEPGTKLKLDNIVYTIDIKE